LRERAMPKAKISVSLDVDLIMWVDEQVEKGVFKNRSQGLEQIVRQRMKGERTG